MESRVNIACPECHEKFHPNEIASILDDQPLMQKYEEFMLRRILVSEPDARWFLLVVGIKNKMLAMLLEAGGAAAW